MKKSPLILGLMTAGYVVAALPQRGFPLFFGDILVARKALPVRLDEIAAKWVGERLFTGLNLAGRLPCGARSLGFRRSGFGLTHKLGPVSGELVHKRSVYI